MKHLFKEKEKNHNWKGGKTISSHGYVLIRVAKKHHLNIGNDYAYEHRIIAEQILNRKLKKGEIVHHLDGNKQNNSIDNIEVHKSIFHHLSKHRKNNSDKRKPGDNNPIICCFCGCGISFLKYDKSNRPRKFISGHNNYKNV